MILFYAAICSSFNISSFETVFCAIVKLHSSIADRAIKIFFNCLLFLKEPRLRRGSCC